MKSTSRIAIVLIAAFTASGCQRLSFWRETPGSSQASWPKTGWDQTRRAPSKAEKLNFTLEMASLFEHQGETPQAIQAYRAVLEQDEHPVALHRMGVLMVRQGSIQQAVEHFHRSLALGGENAEVLCDLGYGLYLGRRFAEAESATRRAIELQPDLSRGHANLGMILARTGRYDEALHAFSRAGLSESEARNNLALAMMVEQRFDESQTQYELALRADPRCATARNGLAALNHARNQGNSTGLQQASFTTPTQLSPVMARR